ncbi:BolA protein [Metarhizium robertsii ARSEF 23]|uniref:BolA protein n=1 Tax=Metarhizium robertsii (strain ARSEF 23 / ATCC MYA-3075) TaxID=655844 RepID=A0A0B2XHY5_METRA|nr:BolA protein [Metarhizium robertsii ARSEF 23]KHO11559.1 BolA protein [Metarhizium robertsii ARSEF 23]
MRLPSSGPEPNYTALGNSDSESQSVKVSAHTSFVANLRARLRPFFLCLSAIVSLGFVVWVVLAPIEERPAKQAVCTSPPIRREWRALTLAEKHDFIRAIHCISKTPSARDGNLTIYDDIAVLHGGIGSWCHRSACFLPWHRNILAVIEKILKDRCHYRGSMPYWDWSLDWMNLANSSIWDHATGFGGDGDKDGPETVGEGRCVTDGPFTELRPVIYNHTRKVHCLSRGFRDGDIKGRLSGEKFSPENVGSILRLENYTDFLQRVERDLHNTLHTSINGDFKAMTAANDPLFFLHHANLDRLWWRWQRENPSVRLFEYSGRHMYNSTGPASDGDVLMYGGFTNDLPVREVMSTEGRQLCYTY